MQYYTVSFVANILILAIEYSFSWLPCPFDILHHFVLSTSLLSGTMRWFWLILYYFLPHLGTSHFSKKPLFFLLENDIRN